MASISEGWPRYQWLNEIDGSIRSLVDGDVGDKYQCLELSVMETSSVCTTIAPSPPSLESVTPQPTKENHTMDEAAVERRGSMDLSTQPPGTVYLGTGTRGRREVVLQPSPTNDPNDPLIWSKARKAIIFTLCLFYVLFTFVLLNVASVLFGPLAVEIGLTYDDYNAAIASNYCGLAVGCIIFIPTVHKYGRRPIYLLSLVIQLAASIWGANLSSVGEYIAINVLAGFGGAISETLVQITIADLFFVHQYGTMNGMFLFAQAAGSFLGPVAAGYVVTGQGWRWTFWWCAIFIGISIILVAALFEDTIFVPCLTGVQSSHTPSDAQSSQQVTDHFDLKGDANGLGKGLDEVPTVSTLATMAAQKRPYRERVALFQKTDASIKHHFYQPFLILARFPAVWYSSLIFGTFISWYSVQLSVMAVTLIQPPYSFDSSQVGLFFFAPFVGLILATAFAGPFSDWSIVKLARRNGGVYEPEMRLYPGIPSAFLACGGILMYGIGIAKSAPWIVLAVGLAIYTTGFIGCADISLAYLTDSYSDIIGDAMVAVVFVRNAVSVIIMFSLNPWVQGMGTQNTFILVAMLALAVGLIPVPLLLWGKKARASTKDSYDFYAKRQPFRRH